MNKSFLSIVVASMALSGCMAVPTESVSTPVLVVPVAVKESTHSVYSCQIKAFTSQYTAEDTNRGKALLKVKKQCLNQHHEMFCKDEYITCKEYN